MWTQVLTGITTAIKAQSSRKVLPSIDHGRVDHFVLEWRDNYAEVTAKHPGFHAAFDEFCAAWEGAPLLSNASDASHGAHGVWTQDVIAAEEAPLSA